MSILEKLPDDPQREIELLREVIKAKDALIAELSKRPVVVPYPTYPSYPTWPSYPWKYTQPWEQIGGPFTVTTSSTSSGSIAVDMTTGKTIFTSDP